MTGAAWFRSLFLTLLTAIPAAIVPVFTAEAAALRVAPVGIELTAPDAVSSIRIWNDGDTPVNVQVRVFRWVQRDGEDVLEPTTAVVVSPPIATLQPGAENIVRVIRIAEQPVTAEESYRLIVDELPDPFAGGAGVNVVVRHSIPVFIAPPATGPATVTGWRVEPASGGYLVALRNDGGTRLRITDLVLADIAGTALGRREGLVGYVLAGSTMEWFIRATEILPPGSLVTIAAEGDTGPLDASVRVQGP